MVGICNLLVYIAKNMAKDKIFKNSTRSMAKDFPLSQQSISRKLIEMEESGMIQRKVTREGIHILITNKGWSLLRNAHQTLSEIFSLINIFDGRVVSGLGEGRYYTEQKEYQKQFKDKLGFKPYPGTFNLEVNFMIKNFLHSCPKLIEGFVSNDRSFGNIKCYKAKLNNKECYLVVPERNHHNENIIEFIAPFYIRGDLNISDDDTVEVEIL